MRYSAGDRRHYNPLLRRRYISGNFQCSIFREIPIIVSQWSCLFGEMRVKLGIRCPLLITAAPFTFVLGTSRNITVGWTVPRKSFIRLSLRSWGAELSSEDSEIVSREHASIAGRIFPRELATWIRGIRCTVPLYVNSSLSHRSTNRNIWSS